MRPLLSLASCLAPAALLLAGCSEAAAPTNPGPPLTQLPRPLSVAEETLVAGSNAFGLELAARTAAADPRANVVLSPLSASMALGMALTGADGTTFEAMRSALGFRELTHEEVGAAYRALIDLLAGLDPDVRFEIANAIWTDRDMPFEAGFLEDAAADFDASVTSADFADPATLQQINAWVRERTGGLIDSILETLPPDVVALLLNAIYFDGAWATQFDPADTRSGPFTRPDGSTVETDMMVLERVELPRAYGEGWVAVELPYGREAFSMVVVVPQGDADARELLAGMDETAWDAMVGGLAQGRIDLLSIPKLTLSYDAYLNDALRAMGMDAAFRPGADFTRMSPVGDQMCIDFVRQKAYVEVDERGTRAAAATGVGIGLVSFNGIVADRPFLFAIRERISGTILFLGLVEDPTAEDPGAEPTEDTCR